jgi:hypothetical protein
MLGEPQKASEPSIADPGMTKRFKQQESSETKMTMKTETDKSKVFESMFLKDSDKKETNEDRKPGYDFMTRCVKWGLQ